MTCSNSALIFSSDGSTTTVLSGVLLAFAAIDDLSKFYPPMVVGHRDVIHVHKYWWSLFENVGLTYDSHEQFDGPIMVDEFGGDYLDPESAIQAAWEQKGEAVAPQPDTRLARYLDHWRITGD